MLRFTIFPFKLPMLTLFAVTELKYAINIKLPQYMESQDYIIETNRCVLRPFTRDDLDILYKLWNDKDICNSMECEPVNYAKIVEKQERYQMWMDRFNFTNFAVFHKDTGEFIGSAVLSLFHDEDGDRNPLKPINDDLYEFRDVELGYVLHKKFWHQGYGSELAYGAVEFIFSNYTDIERIVAVTVPSNINSQKILTKIGFEFICDIDSKHYGKEKFFMILKNNLQPIK